MNHHDIRLIEIGQKEGYGRAVKEIVAWLRDEQSTCDCSARCENECACGAWDDWKTVALEPVVDRLEAKFGGRDVAD